MKNIFFSIIFILFLSIGVKAGYALDEKVCPCGYNPGGDCAPCKEMKETISDPARMEDDTTFKDIQCKCDYDPGIGCLPCKDDQNNKTE